MSDFGDTTGTANPIFKIMNQQGMSTNPQMNPNPMVLNTNSMAQNPNPNQFGMQNPMNQGNDVSKLQQSNPMNLNQSNPMGGQNQMNLN